MEEQPQEKPAQNTKAEKRIGKSQRAEEVLKTWGGSRSTDGITRAADHRHLIGTSKALEEAGSEEDITTALQLHNLVSN